VKITTNQGFTLVFDGAQLIVSNGNQYSDVSPQAFYDFDPKSGSLYLLKAKEIADSVERAFDIKIEKKVEFIKTIRALCEVEPAQAIYVHPSQYDRALALLDEDFIQYHPMRAVRSY
jgi:hypothetical protein